MSAMNGSAVSFRTRGVLVACMAIALLASALFASNASAKTPLTRTAYLALGDSISFGYKASSEATNIAANKEACEAEKAAAEHGETEKLLTEGAKCNPTATYEQGFVGDFAKTLAKTEKAAGHELETLNMGCPGETSGGLIGNGPLGTGLEALRASESEPSLVVSAPCAYHNLQGSPLKTEIGFGSELEAAESVLKGPVPVTAVTLQIGSNDELGTIRDCFSEEFRHHNGYLGVGEAGILECIEGEVSLSGKLYPGGVFTHILTNIGVTISVLRSAGYNGPIVLLGFYNPEAFALKGSDALQAALNSNLEAELAGNAYGPGVKLAQPFPVFNPEAALYTETETSKEHAKKTAKEKKALEKYTEYPAHGDVHPTAAGYQELGKLIAAAL